MCSETHRFGMKSTNIFRLYYVFAFLRGFIFWYVIEKVFLRQAGLSDQQIILMAGMRGATSLLLEIPTGALGDRWGYKKTLALSLGCLGWSGLQYLVWDGFANFLLATTIWTASEALASGTMQAYLYGLVVRREGEGRYRHYASRARALVILGVMTGSVIGSLMTIVFPLWVAFAISVLPVFAALAVLKLLPVVDAGRTGPGEVSLSLLAHGLMSLKHVLINPDIRRILLAYVIIALPMLTFLELTQLQYLSVGLAVALFGPVDFIRFGASMVGNLMGGSKMGILLGGRRGTVGMLALLAGLLWALYIWRSPWSVLLICAITFVIAASEVNLDAQLQRKLPDHIRAAATSSVSFVCNLIWCTLMLALAVFGARHATYTLIGALAVITTTGVACVYVMQKIGSPQRQRAI